METNIGPPRVHTHRPMQVRFFRDRELDALEASLNEWLAEREDREIVDVRQSVVQEAGGTTHMIYVGVWYIEG